MTLGPWCTTQRYEPPELDAALATRIGNACGSTGKGVLDGWMMSVIPPAPALLRGISQ